jgi:(p)ppGpp synthase/HD superfamily hydrolase
MIAKANGKVVPLDYELKNGDRVEIITDKSRKPSVTWLSFVKTSRAREVIKAYINREQRDDILEKGRDILNSYLQKHFGKGLDKDMSLLKVIDGRELDTKGKEDLLVQIGNLSRKPGSVIRAIREAHGIPYEKSEKSEAPSTASKTSKAGEPSEKAEDGAPSVLI